MKGYCTQFAEWFQKQTPTARALIVLIPLLILGILIRWPYIIDGIRRGFGFYAK